MSDPKSGDDHPHKPKLNPGDQAALHELLGRIHGLGLALLEVGLMAETGGDDSWARLVMTTWRPDGTAFGYPPIIPVGDDRVRVDGELVNQPARSRHAAFARLRRIQQGSPLFVGSSSWRRTRSSVRALRALRRTR